MPLKYGLAKPALPAPILTLAQAELARDIKFTDDYEVSPAGDYLTVEQVAAAEQSVYNELRTDPFEVPTVPEYGIGVAQSTYEAMTPGVLESLQNRAIARTSVNPRISKVDEVSIRRDPSGPNRTLTTVIATAGARRVNVQFKAGGS